MSAVQDRITKELLELDVKISEYHRYITEFHTIVKRATLPPSYENLHVMGGIISEFPEEIAGNYSNPSNTKDYWQNTLTSLFHLESLKDARATEILNVFAQNVSAVIESMELFFKCDSRQRKYLLNHQQYCSESCKYYCNFHLKW